MTPFTTTICTEGSKKGLRITIPANIVNQMRATGWQPPGWVRLHIDDCAPVFVMARYPLSRPSVTCTLPTWAFPAYTVGQKITARAEDPTPYRAREGVILTPGVDWLPLVDDAYFPVQEAATLVLWSRYEEPFKLTRIAPFELWWLLGAYQAEGSKSVEAPDWTLANANVAFLAAIPPTLAALGIPRERQYVEVLHARSESPVTAEATFALVGVRHTVTRPRTNSGKAAGVLHVQKSQPLLRLFKAMFARVFAPTWQWPSKEAARAYALGWLAGDATITLDQRSLAIELRLAGYEDEQTVTLRALEHSFGWSIAAGAFGTPETFTRRGLSLRQSADLAAAGAFKFSLSRARLIYALGARLRSFKNQGRSLTSETDYEYAQAVFDTHLHDEAQQLSKHPLAAQQFVTGVKGQPYPQMEQT